MSTKGVVVVAPSAAARDHPGQPAFPLLTLDLMRAVVAVAAHELRTKWRAWVGLALLVAFAGGCVLTAAAGARRTDSAYQRFLVA